MQDQTNEAVSDAVADLISGLLVHGRDGAYEMGLAGQETLRAHLSSIHDAQQFETVLLEVIDFACFLERRQRSPRAARAIIATAERASVRLVAFGRALEGARSPTAFAEFAGTRARPTQATGALIRSVGAMSVARLTPPSRHLRP